MHAESLPVNDILPRKHLSCYRVTADPFEQQGYIDQLSRDPEMQQSLADISSNSDQVGFLLNPQDVTVQAMMTVYAPMMGMMPHLFAHKKYRSQEGTLFQRNILLSIAMICDVETTFREVGSFTSLFSDILGLDGKLSTIGSFEDVEDNKIHFTLYNGDHPIDVCWDLQTETTTLTMDDYRIRKIVGEKGISVSMSEIFAGLHISPTHRANFLFPLIFKQMSFPFFSVTHVHFRNPINPPGNRVLELLESDTSKPLDPA